MRSHHSRAPRFVRRLRLLRRQVKRILLAPWPPRRKIHEAPVFIPILTPTLEKPRPGAIERAEYELQMAEQFFGKGKFMTTKFLSHLGGLYQAAGRYQEAEAIFQRVCSIHAEVFGPSSELLIDSLDALSMVYYHQRRWAEAIHCCERARRLRERTVGADDPSVGTALNLHAGLLFAQGRYRSCEPLYRRSLAIYERRLGPRHPFTATAMCSLGEVSRVLGRRRKAEAYYQRALAVTEDAFGAHHPYVADVLERYATFLRRRRQWAQASRMAARARGIRLRQALRREGA